MRSRVRVKLERVPRKPPWPLWAVAIVLLWLALLLGAEWLGDLTGRPTALCRFRALTSLPCPTCGTTRMVRAILAGRPLDAWHYNPAVAVITLLLSGGLLLRVLFARRLAVRIYRGRAEGLLGSDPRNTRGLNK